MNDGNPEDQLMEFGQEIGEEYLYLFSLISGTDLESEMTDDQRERLKSRIDNEMTQWGRFLTDDYSDEDFVNFSMRQFANIGGELINEDIEEDSDSEAFLKLVSLVSDQLSAIISDYRELSEGLYFETADVISQKVVEEGLAEEATENIGSIFWERHGVSLLQQLVSRHDPHFNFILKNPEVSENRTVEQYLEIYYARMELFKKLSPYLLYSIAILNGEDRELDELVQKKLDTLVQMIESRGEIVKFSEPIDSGVRNSIAHPDYTINPVTREVVFKNQGKHEATYTYQTIRELTVETLCLTHALSVFPILLYDKWNQSRVDELV